ncbi:2-hydroxyacid dehydrogenase [Siphonobacter aquaeclarae]|uniref:D-lactate dehydrogenase n=1 Tax=Siphonobacter aquaeclarae TaxID=563176 RepID=A0A1G9R462_9BACT|nr:2-hydroxyacid dehydrogenase [Siphonobacter aquaeclarae]SDM17910.1 D-lactate dehydrogenase [Siphonobacter aquaeclarae]
MEIAFFSTQSYDRETFDRFRGDHRLHYFSASLDEQTVRLAEGFEAICVFVNDRLNGGIIRHLAGKGLKLIALRCAGFNNVDIAAAAEAGVRIVRVPAYSPQAVAEHALALILTLNRKTHKAYNRVREGNFSLERLTGFNLHGRTVGVIGTGLIGSTFARTIHALGMQVLAYDIHPDPELTFAEYLPLEELLRRSDIVSLHCPLNASTRYLIREETLAWMKDGVMLINTGRGALVHTIDVIEALKSGKIGFLGLDVYEQEEHLFFRDLSETIIQDDTIARLMSFPNVLITAHQAFLTQEALDEIARTTLNSLAEYQAGQPLTQELGRQ